MQDVEGKYGGKSEILGRTWEVIIEKKKISKVETLLRISVDTPEDELHYILFCFIFFNIWVSP